MSNRLLGVSSMSIDAQAVAGLHRQEKISARRPAIVPTALLAALMVTCALTARLFADDREDIETALSLAKMLQAGRAVISSKQDLINDPSRGDKGLTGDVVVAAAAENYLKTTGLDPRSVPADSQRGRLLQAEIA